MFVDWCCTRSILFWYLTWISWTCSVSCSGTIFHRTNSRRRKLSSFTKAYPSPTRSRFVIELFRRYEKSLVGDFHWNSVFSLDESRFAPIFRRISHLTVSVNDLGRTGSLDDLSTNVFARVFSTFTSVNELDFGSSRCRRFHARLQISKFSSKMCFSSSLRHLRICVDTFDDCLHLLDGRLPCLLRFVVYVARIRTSGLPIDPIVSKTCSNWFRWLFFFGRFQRIWRFSHWRRTQIRRNTIHKYLFSFAEWRP